MAITDIIAQSMGGASGAQATTMQKSFGADKDQFLKLLMAQLKNQDPLSAPDADKMAEQITQFGQLEQLVNMNSNIEDMVKSQAANGKGQSISLIGKTIEVEGRTISVAGANKGTVGFYLPQACDEVKVEIVDNIGRTVRTIEFGETAQGSSFHAFDGKKDDGTDVPDGTYEVRVSAKTINGVNIQGASITRGQVTGVEFFGNTPIVRIGSQSFTMEDIISVTG